MRGNILPETNLLDAVLLPDPQRMVLESCKEVWHPAWEGRVDAEFVDHFEWFFCCGLMLTDVVKMRLFD